MDRQDVRIVGISSSPRHANTEILVKEALAAASAKYGVRTELVSFKGKQINGCLDCRACIRRRMPTIQEQCVQKDDWRELVTHLLDPVPNGIIIGSPVYFFNVNAQLRAFMERCTSLAKPYWNPEIPHRAPDWSRTAAGAIAIGYHRNGGEEHAISSILQWCLVNGMVVVGSHDPVDGPLGYIGGAAWQDVVGKKAVDAVCEDEWGLRCARVVGEKVAHTAILLASGVE